MPQKISPKMISLIFSVLVICFAVSFYVFGGDDWGGPAELPPGGNVPAPINVSFHGQVKKGGVMLNTDGAIYGLIVDKGNVGIGTTEPAAKLEVVNGEYNFRSALGIVFQPPGFRPGDYAKAGVYSDMSQLNDPFGIAGYFKGRYQGVTSTITEQSPPTNHEYRAVTGGNLFIGEEGQEHAYWGALGVVFHPEALAPGDYAKAGVYSNMEKLNDPFGIAGYFKGRYQGVTSTITEQSPPTNHEYRAVTGGNLFIGEEGQEHAYWGALGSVINLPGSGIVRVGVYSNMEKLNDPDALAGYFVGNVRATGTICDMNGCIGTGGGAGYWTQSGSNLYPNDINVKVGIGTTSPGQKLSVNGVIGVWNANEVNFYTDDSGSSLKGYVGAGRNDDLALISKTNWNWLRIGANNAPITFWANNGADSDENPQVVIMPDGDVGIGVVPPAAGYKLDVEGKIQATGFDTGDITFRNQETDKILWRMFEDEDGLYLENMKTGKIFRFVLEEIAE